MLAAARPVAHAQGSAEPHKRPAAPAAQPASPLWRLMALGAQAKLAVSAPGDPSEREADRAADAVMGGGPMPAIGGHAPPGHIARACAACEAGGAPCAACQEDDRIQRKHDAGAPAARPAPAVPGAARALVDHATSGAARALDARTRGTMESRFGRDFGGVRVHTSAAAAESAQAIQAHAFTIGSDIVFGEGRYAPESAAGQRLLAHELAHVAQGSTSGGGAIRRQLFEMPFEPIEVPFEPMPGWEVPDFEVPDFEEMPEELPEEAPEELPEEAPEEAPEELPEESPEEAPEESPDEGTEESPEESPEESTNPDTSPYPEPFPPVVPAPDEEPDEPDKKCGSKDLPLTQVSFTTGPLGQGGEVTASPLTRCPGNTRGSRPATRIYKPQFDCLRRHGQGGNWVRAHLLHGKTSSRPLFNLHGPGNQMWNLIITDKSLNGLMQSGAEDPAITDVYVRNAVLWYKSKVNSYVSGLDYFGQSITVDYGTYDTTTGTEGPRRGGGTFPLSLTPPHCPVTSAQAGGVGSSGSPIAPGAAGGTAGPAAAGPTTSLEFNSTMQICQRQLTSRTLPVSTGGLQLRVAARWMTSSGSPRPAADCPLTDYTVTLKQQGSWWDSEINTVSVPVGRSVTLRWRHLDPGTYYFVFKTANADPTCCLTGQVSVSSFDAPKPVRVRHRRETIA
jgi:hypothetical protein